MTGVERHAQRVQQLVEGMPRARLCCFGPEKALEADRGFGHAHPTLPGPPAAPTGGADGRIAEHGFVAGADESERSEGQEPESRRRARHAVCGGHAPKLGRVPARSKKEPPE